MAFSDLYRTQVSLLVKTLPHVAKEECFALKGGTAINLFIRDLPRLSVDIDLTYLPVTERQSDFVNSINDRINIEVWFLNEGQQKKVHHYIEKNGTMKVEESRP